MATNDSRKTEESQTDSASEKGVEITAWFSSWYDTAKQKLAETNEFMRHDIQEFTQAVQTDASNLVAATANTMKEKLNINVDLEEASAATRVVKDSLSSFLGNIASKVGPQRPDDDDTGDSAFVGTTSGTKVMSPAEARIYAMRTDPATFCNEPDSESEFHMWLPDFNLEDRKSEISSLMLDCSQIRTIYTKLVPTAVSHCDFWARYFFKIHQHEKGSKLEAEERRALLVERAHKTHDDIEWEDEEDDVSTEIKTTESKNEMEVSPDIPTETCPADLTVVKEMHEIIVLETGKNPETIDTNDLNTVTSLVESEQKDHISTQELSEQTDMIAEMGAAMGKNEKNSINSDLPHLQEHDMLTKVTNEQSQSVEPVNESIKQEDQTPVAINQISSDDKTAIGKTPSSGESSDDWEKDFDLDMTEDEIQQALKESDEVDDIDDDWENWE